MRRIEATREATVGAAITIDTAPMIMRSPMMIRGVSCSPNTAAPIITAVTGSSAPSIAVGVDPILLIAAVVQPNEIAVGKTASPTRQSQSHGAEAGGVATVPAHQRRTAKSDTPNSRT